MGAVVTDAVAKIGSGFQGMIDDIRVYDRALPLLEVGELFSAGQATNSAPTITEFAAQGTEIDRPTRPIAFTIADKETAAEGLVVTARSSNQALLPDAQITLFEPSAQKIYRGNRLIKLAPVQGQSGQALVTVAVSDGAFSASSSFDFRVGLAPLVLSVEARNVTGNYIEYSNRGPLSQETGGRNFYVAAQGPLISWSTDKLTYGKVEYGLTTAYGNATAYDGVPSKFHFASLANLSANAQYHYRIVAKDAAGAVSVSPDQVFTTIGLYGSSSGDGSFTKPWDLETAILDNTLVTSKNFALKPGDTIWLRSGVYGKADFTFISRLIGEADSRLTIRQFPGERAIVDGGISAYGGWVDYWGFEIMSTNPFRRVRGGERPGGINFYGRAQKAINLVVHDTGHPAIGFWSDNGAGGGIYGVVMWGNGLYDLENPSFPDGWIRGSGIYAQNREGNPFIKDVVSFREFTTGFKMYTENGYANNFHVEGNTVFDNDGRTLFAAAYKNPIQQLKVISNYVYMEEEDGRPAVRLGYYDTYDMVEAEIRGNYFVNGRSPWGALYIKKWQKMTFTNNTLVSQGGIGEWGVYIPLVTFYNAATPAVYTWDENVYYGGEKNKEFRVDGPWNTMASLTEWRETTGFDRHSAFSPALPTSNAVFVRPNEYELGRAHITVFNWERLDTVSVDVSNCGLAQGEAFEVRDAQNFLGEPVLRGRYTGASLQLPMNLTQTTAIVGDVVHFETSAHSSKKFNVFVLLKSETELQREDVSGNGAVTAYDAALALEQGKSALEAAYIAERAVE